MSDYVTKTELDEILDKRLRAQTDEIVGILTAFMGQSDKRFGTLETRFDKLETRFDMFEFRVNARFDKLEARMDEFDAKLDKLTNTIDGFVKRLDEVESEQIARDRQFERLLTWARKVSEKTGIPLENL